MSTFAGLDSIKVINITVLLRRYGFVVDNDVCLDKLENLLIDHKLQETANAARSIK